MSKITIDLNTTSGLVLLIKSDPYEVERECPDCDGHGMINVYDGTDEAHPELCYCNEGINTRTVRLEGWVEVERSYLHLVITGVNEMFDDERDIQDYILTTYCSDTLPASIRANLWEVEVEE